MRRLTFAVPLDGPDAGGINVELSASTAAGVVAGRGSPGAQSPVTTRVRSLLRSAM